MPRQIVAIVGSVLLVAIRSTPVGMQAPRSSPPAIVFDGARLIAGDGRAPLDRATFVVRNGTIVSVGKPNGVEVPVGARRVDLTGKTVMPAIIDAHVHMGYRRGLSFSADNYTRENLLDILDRFAYYGVSAVLETGTGRGNLPFEVREEARDGTRYLTAGSGFAMPNAGPGVPMRDAAYGVTTEAEARRDVDELAAKRPDMIKIWVDDRNGTVEKLRPALSHAIIEEAHKHGIRVMAHINALDDAKDLVRAGVDGFAHVVRDKDVDQELLDLLKEHRNVFFLETLWGERRVLYRGKPKWLEEPLLRETLATDEVNQLADSFASMPSDVAERARESGDRLLRNVAALHAAGVKLGLGTDTGGVSGGQYFGLASHVELELLTHAGFSPTEAIVAATRTTAEILALADAGTIAPGKSADFIVLDANPLDSIGNTRGISTVYLRGKEIDRPALRARWTH